MNNILKIERNSNEAFRIMIANQIKKSLSSIRGDLPADIISMINSIDINKSLIDPTMNLGKLFNSKSINKLLSMFYMDLVIQYNDVYKLEDYLKSMRLLFENIILNNMYIALEYKSKVAAYNNVLLSNNSYTSIYTNTFINNSIDTSSELRTNIKSGILTLGDNFINHINKFNTDIKVDLLSSGGKCIYQSDLNNIFTDSYLSPYYQNYIINGIPNNSNILGYSSSEDLLVCLTIRFTSIIHLNRIMFTSLGYELSKVEGLYYSDHINENWKNGSHYKVNIDQYANDFSIELNFDDIYAKEIYIIISQKGYDINKTNATINTIYTKDGLIKHINNIEDKFLDKGYLNTTNIQSILDEDIDHYKELLDIPKESIMVGTRSYIVSITDLQIGLATYSNYGKYQDKTEYSQGFIRNCKFTSSGLPDIINNGIYDSTTLYSISVDDKEIYFKDTENGHVIDASIVEDNVVFENGLYIIKDKTIPFIIYSHFLITDIEQLEIHFNGKLIKPFDYIGYKTDYKNYFTLDNSGFKFLIREDFAKDYEIYNSTILILKYKIPNIDFNNTTYITNDIDIQKMIGFPSRLNMYLQTIRSSYMYTKEPILPTDIIYLEGGSYNPGDIVESDKKYYRCNKTLTYTDDFLEEFAIDLENRIWTNIGAYFYKSYNPNEYREILIDGKPGYDINKAKQEYNLENKLKNILIPIAGTSPNFDFAVLKENVIDPINNFWWGILNELGLSEYNTEVINSVNCYKFITELDYFKDTLVLNINGVYYKNFYQYETDTETTTIINKNVFYIPISLVESGDTVKVSYVPLNSITTSPYSESTIAEFNQTDIYNLNTENTLKLNRYPFIDYNIINSPEFSNYSNVYTWTHKYSVSYIPIEVIINNQKAKDITDYKSFNIPTFQDTQKANDYEYFLNKEGVISFNKNIIGEVIVKYYISGDRFIPSIYMYRSNSLEYYKSPELYEYSLLMNLQK